MTSARKIRQRIDRMLNGKADPFIFHFLSSSSSSSPVLHFTSRSRGKLPAIFREIEYFEQQVRNGHGHQIQEISMCIDSEYFLTNENDTEDNEDHLVATRREDFARLGQAFLMLPNVKKLDLLLHDARSFQVCCELVQVLAQSTALRELKLTCWENQIAEREIQDFSNAIQRMHLTTFSLAMKDTASYQACSSLLVAIARSTSLCTLTIRFKESRMTDEQTQVFIHAIQAMHTLTEVKWTSTPSDSMVESLMMLPKLKHVSLHGHESDDQTPTFRPIVPFIASSSTLHMLSLTDFHWDEGFSMMLRRALENNSTLKHLTLLSTNLTDDKWRQVMPFLRINTTLQSLTVHFFPQPYVPDDDWGNDVFGGAAVVAETVKQIVTNENTALLKLNLFSDSSEDFIRAVELLSGNTTFPVLDYLGSCKCDFDRGACRRLVQAARQNYSLSQYDIHSMQEEEEECWQQTIETKEARSILTTIENLNRAGRRYLLQDASNKLKGIEVLSHESVRNDLDAIYFHLLENPGLCHINCTAGSRAAEKSTAQTSCPGAGPKVDTTCTPSAAYRSPHHGKAHKSTVVLPDVQELVGPPKKATRLG